MTYQDVFSVAQGPDRAMAAFVAHATARRFARGERTGEEESRAGALYLVAAGRLRLGRLARSGREATLAILHPAGLSRLHRGMLRTWLEVLDEGALAYRLAEGQMLALGRAHPGIALLLFELLDREMAETLDHLEDLLLHGIRDGLAHILARHALADPQRVVHLARQELARQI